MLEASLERFRNFVCELSHSWVNTGTFCTSTKDSLLCDTFDLFSHIFNGFWGDEEVFWVRKGKRREGAPKDPVPSEIYSWEEWRLCSKNNVQHKLLLKRIKMKEKFISKDNKIIFKCLAVEKVKIILPWNLKAYNNPFNSQRVRGSAWINAPGDFW